MATKTFTTSVQLQGYIEHICTEAIRKAAQRITAKLKETIDEQYYQDSGFYPNVYERTETFLKSATYTLLSGNSAQIFIDDESMHYSNGFSGLKVVNFAASSMHGSELYQTDTQDFWSAFLEWADNNIILILREELVAQGLKLSK